MNTEHALEQIILESLDELLRNTPAGVSRRRLLDLAAAPDQLTAYVRGQLALRHLEKLLGLR